MISVIIPVYNCEKYLPRCITSVLEQNYNDIEVIIIDDGSTDSSLSICNDFAKNESRIKIISQNNKGVSSARNRGLNEARGEWICFLDADDWLERDILEFAIEVQRVNHTDIVVWSQAEEFGHRTQYTSFSKKEMIAITQFEMDAIRLSAFTGKSSNGRTEQGIRNIYARIIKKKIIQDNHILFNEKLKHHEDMLFMLEVYEAASSVYFTNRVGYHRLMHQNSAINKYYPEIINDNLLTSIEYKKFLDKNYKDNVYYDFYNGMHEYWFIQILNLSILHKENKVSFCEKKEKILYILSLENFKKPFELINKNVSFSKRVFATLVKKRCVEGIVIYIWLYNHVRKLVKK